MGEQMSARSHTRGNEIYYDGNTWRYSDNGNPLQSETRPCIRCGKRPTEEGHDACLGHLEGKDSACCGHGIAEGFDFGGESRGVKNEK